MSKRESPVKPSVALIAGPTASGKSDLAVDLALALGKQGRRAVVINADSAQVYSDLQVLSARPSEDRDARNRASAVRAHGMARRLAPRRIGPQQPSARLRSSTPRIPYRYWSEAPDYICAHCLKASRPFLRSIPAIRDAVRLLDVSVAYSALQSEDPHSCRRLSTRATASE